MDDAMLMGVVEGSSDLEQNVALSRGVKGRPVSRSLNVTPAT